jgi:hypothetical protein
VIYKQVKIFTSSKDIVPLDNEIAVGCLVRSTVDENATGMIVEIISKENIAVLWSTPPSGLKRKTDEIW